MEKEAYWYEGQLQNMLNKQSQIANKRWSYSLRVGCRLTTAHLKKMQHIKKCDTGPQSWMEVHTHGSDDGGSTHL
jgi:hypothetical protein